LLTVNTLKGKFILGIGVIYALIGSLTIVAFYMGAERIIEVFGTKYAVNQALLEKNKVLSLIEREVALALKLADDPMIRQWCRQEHNAGLKRSAFAQLASYRKIFRNQSFFVAIEDSGHYYVYDTKKNRLNVTTLRRDKPADKWFFHTLRDVDSFALNVDYNALLNVIKVWINAVLKDERGKNIAVVGSGIDISDFIKEIITSREEGTAAIIIDKEGVIQAHPHRKYVEHNATNWEEGKKITIYGLMENPEEKARLRQAVHRLTAGTGDVETILLTMEGKKYLAAMSFLKDIRWYNIVLVDVARVIEIKDFLPIAAVIVISFLLIMVMMVTMLNRIVLRPLSVLTDASRQISRGEYDVSLPVTRTDELGQLTSGFNTMAATVRDYTRNLEGMVRERTEELTTANRSLELSQRQIMDSIRYARIIQASILPDQALLARRLQDYFLIYCPRDIVGGDFYYFKELPDDTFLLAVIDCTGHGVPGAFMTMTVNSVLNHITDALCADDPACILGELQRLIRDTLHHNVAEYQIASGLDIGLCHCLPREGRLVFAGAGLSLYRAQGNEVAEIKGSRKRVGHKERGTGFTYENRELSLTPETSLYLTTDGFLDQAGGAKGYGFGRERFMAMIAANCLLQMEEQERIYREILNDYRGDFPQRDDIAFWGFRIR